MPVPANIYENDIDFTTLALQYPQFAKRLKPNGQLDFSDPESVRLNYVLFIQRLLDDTSPDWNQSYDPDRQVIGLDIGTGSSAIYPLLACQQRPQWRFLATEIDEKNSTYAIKNIATNNLRSRIRVVDTDVTGETLIPIREIESIGIERIDIIMTNPPFYPSASSLLESARQKSRPPNSSCTGAPVEMITPGGEVSFVSRLINESLDPKTNRRVQWFSSMLGKLSSVGAIVDKLKAHGCTNFAVAEFIQGQKAKTRRWCVAWSWMGYRPGVLVARGVSSASGVEKRLLPAPSEFDFEVEVEVNPEDDTQAGSAEAEVEVEVGKKLNQEMARLDVLWRYIPQQRVGMVISPHGDVWSRKARRKKLYQSEQQQQKTQTQGKRQEQHGQGQRGRTNRPMVKGDDDQDEEMHDSDPPACMRANDASSSEEDNEDQDQDYEPALVARISLIPISMASSSDPQSPIQSRSQSSNPSTAAESTTKLKLRSKAKVHIRHLRGQDPVLFESFCGWLKRRMSATTATGTAVK
ncbi:hypothetical protein A1O3_06317 [Capronia epimyces CBS 606.96]|uniref:U6 small nuclear RNA (adenine-(43)-N(6))-methyltransferase n=1 Tax=Capronia epimyces CBS 606.96 TaxID=1182542 RepID=W9YJR3_9EURO|nr:uncharacterized protein A1O3_06317 [Capronia epimyces CBS 606.96]EXJ82504.1 hypothetical protein A1O3_06317 [Capronia epimyces CBS 606.96]